MLDILNILLLLFFIYFSSVEAQDASEQNSSLEKERIQMIRVDHSKSVRSVS